MHQGVETGTEHVREDLVYWRARNLPDWAEHDPVVYFAAAETGERVKGVAYTEWRFNVPREMTRREQMDTARDVLQASFGTQHPYVWALHDARAADGGRNVHVHVLWSARTLDGLDRTEDQFFKRYNAAHPERGGARKDPEMNHMGAVKAARVQYVDIVNAHLEYGGYEARLHPDSLEARGIDRAPEPKLLPSDSNRLKYHSEVTERMQQVFDHRFARTQSAPAEMANAQQYWQERKMELDIITSMPMAEQLRHIAQARTQAITRTPHVERLLAQGPDHGLPRDPQAERAVATFASTLDHLRHEGEQVAGAALRIRLFERDEHERDHGLDRGMGF